MPAETATAAATATETLVDTPTATVFPPEPPLTLLYSDNFDSGALYVWNVGAGWALAPSENGLALRASNTLEPVAFAHATLLDAAAEARFQLQGGGVQFHLRQSSVGAYTALVTADGQVALSRAGVPLAGAAIAPVAPDQWIAVRLSAIGEVIRVAVNGVEVITAVDPIPLPPGTVAFASTGSSLLVDEFRLWQVASAMPAVVFPTPTATLFPEPELGLIFTNDFSVVDFGYWSWGADWTFVPRADQLALETAGQSEATLLWGAMRDIALEARFQLHAGALAVHLRQSEAGRYSAEVDTSGVLRLYRNGQAFGTAQTEVTPGVWHHLRFSAIDDRLRVSLDGVEVLAVVDPAALPAGGVTLAGQPDGLLRIGDVSAWQPHAVLAAAMVPNAPTSLDASSAALTTQTTSDERIVFTSYRDGDPEIFILDPLACSVGVDCPATQLTFNAVTDDDPRLSPDGQSIAYTSVIDGNYEIYVMNVDGSNNRRLTNHTATDDDPTWSPDGSQIAFASSRSGDYDIYLINADGSSPCGANPCRLTTTSDYERGPAWSSSGIAFYAGVNTELYLMNADGSGRRQLTSSNSVDQNPAWSPDGNWLAFTTNRYGNLSNYDIAKLDIRQCATPATCPVTRLTTDVNYDFHASWSPDGTQLAFTSSRNGFDQIYVMNADGSNQTRLTYTDFNRHPDWGSSPLFCPSGSGVMGMQGVSSAICLPLETATPTSTVTPTLTPTPQLDPNVCTGMSTNSDFSNVRPGPSVASGDPLYTFGPQGNYFYVVVYAKYINPLESYNWYRVKGSTGDGTLSTEFGYVREDVVELIDASGPLCATLPLDDGSGGLATVTPTPTLDPNTTPEPTDFAPEAAELYAVANQLGLPAPFTHLPTADTLGNRQGYGPNEFAYRNQSAYRFTNHIHTGLDFLGTTANVPASDTCDPTGACIWAVAVCRGQIVEGRRDSQGQTNGGSTMYGSSGAGLSLQCYRSNHPDDNTLSSIVVTYNHLDPHTPNFPTPGATFNAGQSLGVRAHQYYLCQRGPECDKDELSATCAGTLCAASRQFPHIHLEVIYAPNGNISGGQIRLNPALLFSEILQDELETKLGNYYPLGLKSNLGNYQYEWPPFDTIDPNPTPAFVDSYQGYLSNDNANDIDLGIDNDDLTRWTTTGDRMAPVNDNLSFWIRTDQGGIQQLEDPSEGEPNWDSGQVFSTISELIDALP